jgi:sulfur-carrier protein
MPRLVFTAHLKGVAPPDERDYPGETVRAVLEAAFAEHPPLRHYVLDDQGGLRKHVVVFADGKRAGLGDAVVAASEIYVLQALSGG